VLTQLFTANLSDREARLSKTEFIISVRQFIGLPALKIPRGELVELKCGCEAQKCPNAQCAGVIIDPAGNHALLCHGGMGARKATLLERALERAFRKAGGRADRQPPSTRLLGDIVPKEDLAALFPGGLNLEETKKSGALAIELVDALLMPRAVSKTQLSTKYDHVSPRWMRRYRKATSTTQSASTFAWEHHSRQMLQDSAIWTTQLYTRPQSRIKMV